MALLLGSTFPDFDVETSTGRLKLHEYQGDSWLIFFSHPADYTPVCTTELARAVRLMPEFKKRNVKLIGLSCDSTEDHVKWGNDVMFYCKKGDENLPFPLIADAKRDIAHKLGMIEPNVKNSEGMPLTCRAVFIIDPAHAVRLSILYPASTGRNFDEILRVVDSLQLTDAKKIVTPVDWKVGEKVIIPPTAAAENYSNGVEVTSLPSKREYMRFTTVQ